MAARGAAPSPAADPARLATDSNSSPTVIHDHLDVAGEPARTVPGLGLVLLPIPAGTFMMGSPDNEQGRFDREGPLTVVNLPVGFWMGKYAVTQKQWKDLMGTDAVEQARRMLNDDTIFKINGSARTIRASLNKNKDADPMGLVGDLADDIPINWVNWAESAEFCRRLNERERAAGRVPPGFEYRLPTEAEYEYACRAGTTGPSYAVGTQIANGGRYPELENIAWFGGNLASDLNSKSGPQQVGGKLPNAWGLYDMLGNVNSWCFDWYAEQLAGGVVTAPHGPETGIFRTFRGGSWKASPNNVRSALRNWFGPDYRFEGLGLRVTLAPIIAPTANALALDQTIADLSRALSADPKNTGAHVRRGLAKRARGDIDGAIDDFSQAIALDPKDSRSRFNRGIAENAKHDFVAALADFATAVPLDPKTGYRPEDQGGEKPLLYADAIDGTHILIESDGRHATGVSKDGVVLWRTVPIAHSGLDANFYPLHPITKIEAGESRKWVTVTLGAAGTAQLDEDTGVVLGTNIVE